MACTVYHPLMKVWKIISYIYRSKFFEFKSFEEADLAIRVFELKETDARWFSTPNHDIFVAYCMDNSISPVLI